MENAAFDDWLWDRIVHLLSDESFETFLMASFLIRRNDPDYKRIPLPNMRLVYLYYVFNKIKICFPQVSLGSEFLTSFELAVKKTERTQTRMKPIKLLDVRGNSEFKFPARSAVSGIRCELALDQEHSQWLKQNESLNRELIGLARMFGYTTIGYLFKCLERESRGQANNLVWHLLRLDLISATRFHSVLTSGLFYEVMSTQNATISSFAMPSLQFGNECEPIVKALVETFLVHRQESAHEGLGLLVDPESGLLAASVDLAFGVVRTKDNSHVAYKDVPVPIVLRRKPDHDPDMPWLFDVITVEPNAQVFEIKCRYKYLRDRDDVKVKNLLKEPTYKNLVALLLDHNVPAVEYRKRSEIPSVREALLSHDLIFKPADKRSRSGHIPPGIYQKHIRELLKTNAKVKSTALIFDANIVWEDLESDKENLDPGRLNENEPETCKKESPGSPTSETEECEAELRVVLRAKLENLPIFMNPKHQYFTQVLLQQYILSQYYIRDHPTPEYIVPEELPSATLVSAIFRRRDQDEQQTKFLTIGSQRFTSEYVPLLILCTPMGIVPSFTFDAVTRVVKIWESAVTKRTEVPLWEHNAADSYLAASVSEPVTP